MNNTFLLFYSSQALEPSMNFNILKVVYFVFEWIFFFEGVFRVLVGLRFKYYPREQQGLCLHASDRLVTEQNIRLFYCHLTQCGSLTLTVFQVGCRKTLALLLLMLSIHGNYLAFAI